MPSPSYILLALSLYSTFPLSVNSPAGKRNSQLDIPTAPPQQTPQNHPNKNSHGSEERLLAPVRGLADFIHHHPKLHHNRFYSWVLGRHHSTQRESPPRRMSHGPDSVGCISGKLLVADPRRTGSCFLALSRRLRNPPSLLQNLSGKRSKMLWDQF